MPSSAWKKKRDILLPRREAALNRWTAIMSRPSGHATLRRDHRYRAFFFFNDPATTEIYTLSLPDALPISRRRQFRRSCAPTRRPYGRPQLRVEHKSVDRKTTLLNSSDLTISHAAFCW